MARGARMLAAAALGAAVFTLAPASPMRAVLRPAEQAQAAVFIRPGTVELRRERRQGPSSTGQCQQALQISCYNPAQIQQAYNLPSLYAKGVNGKGATIVIVDPYGSPTISKDLSTFDSQ